MNMMRRDNYPPGSQGNGPNGSVNNSAGNTPGSNAPRPQTDARGAPLRPAAPPIQPVRPNQAAGQPPAPQRPLPALPPRPGIAPAPGARPLNSSAGNSPAGGQRPPLAGETRSGVSPGAARPAPASPAGGFRPAAGTRPGTKVDDLVMVIRQLSELLTKENAALKRHRTDEVKSFTERKENLARLYQGHMNAVHRDPGLLKVLDVARRTSLTQQAMRLGELMQENAALLKGNIQSINMYFKAVTDAVKERQEKMAAAYSRNGAMKGYIAKRSLAVSFNQTM